MKGILSFCGSDYVGEMWYLANEFLRWKFWTSWSQKVNFSDLHAKALAMVFQTFKEFAIFLLLARQSIIQPLKMFSYTHPPTADHLIGTHLIYKCMCMCMGILCDVLLIIFIYFFNYILSFVAFTPFKKHQLLYASTLIELKKNNFHQFQSILIFFWELPVYVH